MDLIFNIFLYYVSSNFITCTPDKTPTTPKLPHPQLLPQFRKLLKYLTARYAFQYFHHLCRGIPRWRLNKYVHMVFHDFHCIYPELILLSNSLKHFFQGPRNLCTQYVLRVIGYPHQMILQIIYGMFSPSNSNDAVIQGKALFRQASLLRLTTNHFPLTSPSLEGTGIQWSFL